MPRNRSTVYNVVREEKQWEHKNESWAFGAITGTYATIQRAEEVAGASLQALVDRFGDQARRDFRYTVKPSTWYDE